MAIYRLEVKVGNRGKGDSALSKANYILREGKYAKDRGDLVHVEHNNMPTFATDPRNFWKAADTWERANGTLYRELQFALPVELTESQQVACAKEYSAVMFPNSPTSWAMHSGSKENPHIHLIASEHISDEFVRGEIQYFKRHNPSVPNKGGTRKLDISSRRSEWLAQARLTWEQVANKHLSLAGRPERINCKSYEDRNDMSEVERAEAIANRIPKLGAAVLHVEKNGTRTSLVSRIVEDKKNRCFVLKSSFSRDGKLIEYNIARDYGDRITVAGKTTPTKAAAVVEACIAKGWTEIEIFGNPEHQMLILRSAAKRGLAVAGMTEEHKVEYERIRDEQTQRRSTNERNGGETRAAPSNTRSSSERLATSPAPAQASTTGNKAQATGQGHVSSGKDSSQEKPNRPVLRLAQHIKHGVKEFELAGQLLQDYRLEIRKGTALDQLDRLAIEIGHTAERVINAHAVSAGISHVHAAVAVLKVTQNEAVRKFVEHEYGPAEKLLEQWAIDSEADAQGCDFK